MDKRAASIQLTKKQIAEAWDQIVASHSFSGVGFSRYSIVFERFCERLGFDETKEEQTTSKYIQFNENIKT